MKDLFEKAREWVWLEGDPEKDRSKGLAVFGVLEVLLGILSFSIAMLLMIGVASAGLGGMKPIHFQLALGFMFFMTGWFIVMGWGSFKACRWARALVLVGAWVSVFFGSLVLGLMLYILPDIHELFIESGLLPAHGALSVLYYSALVLFLLQVVFPLIAIAFYSLEGVRATCERRWPRQSWTDLCPLPLLVMGVLSAFGSLTFFLGFTTNHVVFLFGHVVSGKVGMLVLLLVSVAFGYVGWGAFTRNRNTWWWGYAIVLLTTTSLMLSFSGMDMNVFYTHMGYSAEQIGKLKQFDPFNPALFTMVSCIWGIMACVYLVWVRDCLLPEKDEVEVKSYQQIKDEERAAEPSKRQAPRMRLD
ncbi:MAG: hypothetical protein OES84_02475 [Kiritimatiellaceae bacterium]|nr:hypothetical protein [Kiritimatiellaceae bacterium]